MSSALHNADLAILASRPSLPALAGFAVRAAVVISTWDMRHRTRKSLAKLDSHALKDIGLTVEDAHREATQPFWKA